MNDPDLVVSLGPSCRNTWNIRDYFQTQYALPFDWWITPVKSMLRMLDHDFSLNVVRDDLCITENGGSVYNRRLNVLHHHDFDRVGPHVKVITDEGIEKLNSKYTYLFARFRRDIASSERPLAVLNGISRGWPVTTPDGGTNADLNGDMEPQAVVDAIRSKLGKKVNVAIIAAGPASTRELEGGRMIVAPDRGEREGLPPGQIYAEPVHIHREAFMALGLKPESLKKPETADNMRISNNTPKPSRALPVA
jgi:hypothetical protein